jgi:hypothetical protein
VITEVLAMRKFPFFLALFLVGCGSDGGSVPPAQQAVQHTPEISNLKLSPGSALYMEGDGSVQVTAEFAFTDLGRDLETLRVEMSDGTSLAIPIPDSVNTASGTLAQEFDVTTADVNGCTVEIWLVDRAGQSSSHLSAAFSVIQHTPEISNVMLSPSNVPHMEGDGSVVVTVEIAFWDTGRDIDALWVRMPDGANIEFDESIALETGTFTEDLTMSTETIGVFSVEFWLVDRAGDSSNPVTEVFFVLGNAQSIDWTNRLSGHPYTLLDVVWNGDVFVVVGRGGTILTSADGVDWITRESGTDANLDAVAADGSYVVAVGSGIILQSNDHGVSWTVKDRPIEASLDGVAINSSQVVVGGNRLASSNAIIMISEDRGETWRAVDSWPDENLPITDLVYGDGMFVAATNGLMRESEAWVTVSSDGNVWNEIAVNDEYNYLPTIFHDDSQFFLAGGRWGDALTDYWGVVYTSMDGFNWTRLQTPVGDVFYRGIASSGAKLLVAGSATCGYLAGKCYAEFDVPVGLSSTDRGVTWDVFNIDGDYESYGLAWGNGRFVSVGSKSRFYPDEGAIYTAE